MFLISNLSFKYYLYNI